MLYHPPFLVPSRVKFAVRLPLALYCWGIFQPKLPSYISQSFPFSFPASFSSSPRSRTIIHRIPQSSLSCLTRPRPLSLRRCKTHPPLPGSLGRSFGADHVPVCRRILFLRYLGHIPVSSVVKNRKREKGYFNVVSLSISFICLFI